MWVKPYNVFVDIQCIYCLQQLGKEVRASDEHVLQGSLGWDETIRCVCEPCNSTFGRTIDASLVGELEPFRVHFDVTNQARKSAKGTGIPVSGSWEGKKVGYDQGGIISGLIKTPKILLHVHFPASNGERWLTELVVPVGPYLPVKLHKSTLGLEVDQCSINVLWDRKK